MIDRPCAEMLNYSDNSGICQFIRFAAAYASCTQVNQFSGIAPEIRTRQFLSAMKRILTIAVAVAWTILLALTSGEARAERRVALVVGNSNYSAVPQLPNPARDANAVAKMFKDAGFEVIETYLDVGNLDFKRAIRKFEDTAVDADVA